MRVVQDVVILVNGGAEIPLAEFAGRVLAGMAALVVRGIGTIVRTWLTAWIHVQIRAGTAIQVWIAVMALIRAGVIGPFQPRIALAGGLARVISGRSPGLLPLG
jgi:hypothetical protein